MHVATVLRMRRIFDPPIRYDIHRSDEYIVIMADTVGPQLSLLSTALLSSIIISTSMVSGQPTGEYCG